MTLTDKEMIEELTAHDIWTKTKGKEGKHASFEALSQLTLDLLLVRELENINNAGENND